VPTEKRARKKAAREARLAAEAKARKRRQNIRRVVTFAVLVAVAAGIYAWAGGFKSNPKKSAAKSTTTTSRASTSTSAATSTTQAPGSSSAAQSAADEAAVAAGCPSSPTQPLTKGHWSSPPAMTIDTSKTYTATVQTDVGTFTITLDAKSAPETVNNFVFLANQHFFDCEAFMRVVPGFMNQTGSPDQSNGGSTSGPGYQFKNENDNPSGGYVSGDVAMANSGPNTNGSQFFILAGPYSSSGYSLFGHVGSGMDVVKKINADGNSDPQANGVPPKVVHRMLKVTISES
jgi:cyclophilin family peptidyl-prolyl cis-trans isomerase